MVLFLILVALILWILYFWYKRRNLYRLAAKIPEAEGAWPIVGHAHTVSGNSELIMSSLRKLSYSSMRHDGIVAVWFGFTLQFVIVDPVDGEFILKTCLEKHDLHRFIREFTGNGSAFSPVSIWRPRRKIAVQVFRPKVVENFVNVFVEQSQKLAKILGRFETGKNIDMWPFLFAYSIDSSFESTLGIKLNSQDQTAHPLLDAMNQTLNLICDRMFHLWLHPNWLYRWFPQHKAQQESMTFMNNYVDKVIEDVRRNDNGIASTAKGDQENDKAFYERQTFLQLLIKLSGGENGYTNLELREEIGTLIFAATDTSATAMGFTLLLLAKYPEEQTKVYQELYEVFGDSDRPLVNEDFTKLTYLDRVVKESMRLMPPVPFVVKQILKDIKLPSGRVLPAGSGALCSIWGSHRDPKYWGPDAEHFNPDRFLPERLNLKHPCSYMPFGNGPRNCVGYLYAILSIKAVLSTILREYRIVPDRENGPIPKIRVKMDIMLKPVNGYQIALEKRNKVHSQHI